MTNEKKIYKYEGEKVDVFWDQRLCIHIGECGRAQGELFVGGRDPWCRPDVTSVDEVVEIVDRCPSGALTYLRKDGGAEPQPAPTNAVTVTRNGPLNVSGDLHIEGAPSDMEGVRFRAALCRCGASKNKPFCDNSHEDTGFLDSGAVGMKGDGLREEGGPLEIRPAPNGPLLLAGNLTIRASSGRAAWQGSTTALCRCGGSKNKPFCDGSHKALGFEG